jgi:hypothetical protein
MVNKGFYAVMAIRRNTFYAIGCLSEFGVWDTDTGEFVTLTTFFATFAKTGKSRVAIPCTFGSGFS